MKNNTGYGVNNPINVHKSKRTLVVSFITSFLLLVLGLFVHFAILEPNNATMSSSLDCVYADSYVEPDTWTQKSWTGLSSFSGTDVWSDGINYYYSNGSSWQKVLDVSTSTWSTKTWNGYTGIGGYSIWNDGINYYFSSGTSQYVLDVSTSTWTQKTWYGLTDFYGYYVWSVGTNYYYSDGTNNYVLDISTSTWSQKTWNGYSIIYGDRVWSDGINYYYSYASAQFVLDTSTSTWSAKTWNGTLSALNGQLVWSDGTNYYYSSSSSQHVLDVSTSTWSQKTWYGLTSYNGNYVYDIFSIDNTVYYSRSSNHYELVKDSSGSPTDIVPSFNSVQYGPDILLTFDSNLDQLDIYSDMIFNIYIADDTFTTKNLIASFDTAWFDDVLSVVSADYSWIFNCSLPYRYITFEWYYSSTNYYYVDFEYSSFTWSNVEILDNYDSSNVHTDFTAFSPYGTYSSPNVFPFFFAFHDWSSTDDFVTFDVYSYLTPSTLFNSFHADSGSSITSNSNINYLISSMSDTNFANSVSYRGKFVFSDIDFYPSFYTNYYGLFHSYGNGFTLNSGFTFNYYDFFVDLGVDTETAFSSWFYVPYQLDSAVLSLQNYSNLVWTSVSGADYYNLYLNGNEYVTNLFGNNYVISELGDYEIEAISNTIGITSSWSNTITVTAHQLDTPVITLTYSNLTWESVDNADYYILYVYSADYNDYVIYASNIKSTGYVLIMTGEYKVRAVSNSALFDDSSLSNSVNFVGAWIPGGSSNGNTIASLIGAVVDVPVHYIVSLFDFDMDFLGFNMLNLILSLFTLCVVIFIFKFVFGHRR